MDSGNFEDNVVDEIQRIKLLEVPNQASKVPYCLINWKQSYDEDGKSKH